MTKVLSQYLNEAYEAAKHDPEHLTILKSPEGYVAMVRVFPVGDKNTVIDLVAKHEISASRGAEILNIPYRKFLELLADRDIALLDYDEMSLNRELAIFDKPSKSKSKK